jgi:thiamine biosynthesis protein ThiI
MLDYQDAQKPIFSHVLISPSEIALKSRPVRSRLNSRLMNDLRLALKIRGFEGFRIITKNGRLVIENLSDALEGALVCAKVFGVAIASPAIRIDNSLKSIVEASTQIAIHSIRAGETFAVRAHCVGRHPFNGRQIEADVGKNVLSQLSALGVSVDLRRPRRTVFIEVREECAYVYLDRIEGPGGIPIGSQGRMLGVITGVESILSCFLIMRRGAFVIPSIFDVTGTLKQRPDPSLLHDIEVLRAYIPRLDFHGWFVPLGACISELFNSAPSELFTHLVTELMLRAATYLAKREKASALVIGERLGTRSFAHLRQAQIFFVRGFPVMNPVLAFTDTEVKNWLKALNLLSPMAEQAAPYACSEDRRSIIEGSVSQRLDELAIHVADRAQKLSF